MTTLSGMSADPLDPDAVDIMTYRRVVGTFATGISVATTRHRGIDHAMTVNAFASVSLDPLLVLICVEKITRFHSAVRASGSWAVSVLAADAEDVARWFAEKARPTRGQMADYPHRPGRATGMPVLEQAIAVIECRTHAIYEGGDHVIVLGDVVGVWSDPAPHRPLLYFQGRYRQLP
jgi:flavin reductase (DIM6/NTAB) family NADH-FMN oxidoreductase RutF